MTPSHRVPLLVRFWLSDYGLHALLVTLVLAMFVAPAFVAAGVLPRLVIEVFFMLMVAAGVATVWRRGLLAIAIIVLATLAVASRWITLGMPAEWSELLDAGASTVLVAMLAALIAGQVFRSGPVTLHRIEGAVALYLLAGVLWGSAYRLIWIVTPGAFLTGAGPVTDPSDLNYLSFVTLTTVGYGDVVPTSVSSRGLAMVEALVGQLYPAVLLARLVSLELAGGTPAEH